MYEEEDEGLLERVRKVWETSERVGGKVRRLDVEVGRVKESVDIVSEVIDLKVCEMCLLRSDTDSSTEFVNVIIFGYC